MLKSEREALKLPDLEVYPLAEFIRGFPFPLLTIEQKTVIVDQAILMFQHLYPDLPFKQQQFSFADPLQELGVDCGRNRPPQWKCNFIPL